MPKGNAHDMNDIGFDHITVTGQHEFCTEMRAALALN